MAPVNKFNIKSFFHGDLKDKNPNLKKSGIYQMECQDCDKVYFSLTRRNITTRAKEHLRNINNEEVDKSSVAKHCCEESHRIKKEPVLLKEVIRPIDLPMQEKIFIFKRRARLMNEDLEGLDDLLLSVLVSESEEGCAARASVVTC